MKKSRKITLLTSIIFIGLGLIISVLKSQFKLVLYIFNNTSSNIVGTLYLIGSIFLTIFLIQVILSKKKKSQVNNHLFNLLIVGIIVIELLLVLYIQLFVVIHDNKYFKLVSDDSKHTVIVEEQSFLLAGYGNFYERKNFLFVKKIGSYLTDDGYRPFSDNRYSVEWLEDGAKITYGFGSGGVEKLETLYYTK
jgi:hypothetical protein